MVKQVVSTLIVNKKFQILLMLRDNKPGIMYPGLWAFIGGHVEKVETPRMAAVREILEETGLRIRPKRLGLLMSIQTPFKKSNIFLVFGEWKEKDCVKGEGQKLRFIHTKKTSRLPMSPYHRYVLSVLNEHLQKKYPVGFSSSVKSRFR